MRLPRLSPTAYRRLALATLASLVLVSVLGAVVRLTGSGLGCSTWPSCEPDSFTPRSASDGHAMVEYVNRMVNAAVGLLTIATVVGARLRRPQRPDLFRWALGVLAWVVSNGLVGALVVWFHLSPVSVIGHFVLALGAIWNALVLVQRSGEAEAPAPGRRRALAATAPFLTATRVLVGAAGVVLLSGTLVTGSGPHAGDERADRLALDVGDMARVHGLAMIGFLAATIVVVRMAHRGDAAPTVVQRSHELLVVLVAQAAIGYWQYFTGVPALLVAFHVLGATLVWIAVLRLWFSLTTVVEAGGGGEAVSAGEGRVEDARAKAGAAAASRAAPRAATT
ncbi:MAG TPA: COX15/CtaA family protein [Acidimicrobiales bacterium]